jgi:hypothetical protein
LVKNSSETCFLQFLNLKPNTYTMMVTLLDYFSNV